MRETPDLAHLQQKNRARLAERNSSLLGTYPPEHYLRFFEALPANASYRSVPDEALACCRAIEARWGVDTLEAYHRMVLLHLLERQDGAADAQYPPEVLALLQTHLARIANDMVAPRKRFYLHDNDAFAKDFAVLRGKLLPCGVELVDRGAGVARRTLLSGGMCQLARGLAFFARIGKFSPFYELHFDRRSIGEFNQAGYADMYLRIADLLESDPNAGGVMSSSWWHDPALRRISPELAFIDEQPLRHGARRFKVGANDVATADAIRFDRRRMELHEAGAYRPQVYLLAWTRRDVLAWAKHYRSRDSAEPRPAPGRKSVRQLWNDTYALAMPFTSELMALA